MMYCKECGTENFDTDVICKKCDYILNTNLPLDGKERLSIVGFFIIYLATIFFGIIPIIICLAILYIIKKDKNIKSLEMGKKIILVYLIGLSITLSVLCFVAANFQETMSSEYYEQSISIKDKGDSESYFNSEYYLERSKDRKNYATIFRLAGFIIVPLGFFFLKWMSNILFFNIIKRHEQWIIANGLFADSKNEKSFLTKTTEKIQSIRQEPMNTADELLKWAELKEKGLISEEEFKKAKEKILEGKL